MTLRKRLISLCMVMVLVFSLSAVCASAAQEAVAEQPTVSMSFDLDNRVKHEKTVRLPDGSIAVKQSKSEPFSFDAAWAASSNVMVCVPSL